MANWTRGGLGAPIPSELLDSDEGPPFIEACRLLWAEGEIPLVSRPMSLKPKSVRLTINVSKEFAVDVRSVVSQLGGPPAYLTLSGLVRTAVAREIRRLERRYNKGRPFPKTRRLLRRGRPITR